MKFKPHIQNSIVRRAIGKRNKHVENVLFKASL